MKITIKVVDDIYHAFHEGEKEPFYSNRASGKMHDMLEDLDRQEIIPKEMVPGMESDFFDEDASDETLHTNSGTEIILDEHGITHVRTDGSRINSEILGDDEFEELEGEYQWSQITEVEENYLRELFLEITGQPFSSGDSITLVA